jgi:hypothetical protein
MLMLLDETSQGQSAGAQQPVEKSIGYHIMTN